MSPNPFDVRKADDFSDEEVARLWVDLPTGASLSDLLDPTSPMPLLLVGGKGSGKTHLLRHASFPLQRLRGERNLTGATSEGYIGVYFRCSGLNAERFSDKGQSPARWQSVFEYYMELWVGQLVLETVAAILTEVQVSPAQERTLAQTIGAEIDSDSTFSSIEDLLRFIRTEQKVVNLAVNNCDETHSLDVTVRVTRGHLIFGIPRVVATTMPHLRETRFLYLVDQFEDLVEHHQRYVQTLIRERQYPTSFRVGVRRYGVRTYDTYCAGEINRRGSEYDEVDLDARIRRSAGYSEFARRLAVSRVRAAGIDVPVAAAAERMFLTGLFPAPPSDLLAFEETFFVRETYKGRERPYFERLQLQLLRHFAFAPQQVGEIIDELRSEQYPLLEKANILLLYQAWHRGSTQLLSVARKLRKSALQTVAERPATDQLRLLQHWKSDLLAQLYRDCRRPVRYTGFEKFVAMASGYPRNLLTILKNVVRYAGFEGTAVLAEPASARAQDDGVRESANWFWHDAGIATAEAELIKSCIVRLATLMRSIRYADLPSECSLSSFAVDLGEVSQATRDTLNNCVTWSLLIETSRGHKDKTKEEIYRKYQLNPMIAPRWELPLSRRGVLKLDSDLANAIFDEEYVGQFDALHERRVIEMNAPFGRASRHSEEQINLHGL